MQSQIQRRGGGGLLSQSQSRVDLDMLTEQRKALQEQAEQLTGRRNVLFAQLRNTTDQGARGALESRMSEIDGRLASLDNQVAKLNDQISEAMGRVRTTSPTPGPSPTRVFVEPRVISQTTIPPFEFAGRSRGADMRDVAGFMAAEAVVLALIGVGFWQFGLRRLRARFERVERSVADQSSQLNQLQQSADVIGLEVERISEGQRYVAKVLGEGAAVDRGLIREQPERHRG
jgi:cell division protein FtsB